MLKLPSLASKPNLPSSSECVAKRRKLVEEGAALSESSSPADVCSGWTPASSCPSLSVPAASPPPPHQEGVFPQNPPAPGRLEAEGSCMEVDAAQRRLREIEDRWAARRHLVRLRMDVLLTVVSRTCVCVARLCGSRIVFTNQSISR